MSPFLFYLFKIPSTAFSEFSVTMSTSASKILYVLTSFATIT